MQNEIEVKFVKLPEYPEVKMPTQAHEGDAGWDLYVAKVERVTMPTGRRGLEVSFGIALEIPEGHVGFIFPRSSIWKSSNRLTNHVGVIGSNYRGEIKAIFDVIEAKDGLFGMMAIPSVEDYNHAYAVGERCAQLIIMPYPKVKFVEVDKLSETDRGTGGFGSSGKN